MLRIRGVVTLLVSPRNPYSPKHNTRFERKSSNCKRMALTWDSIRSRKQAILPELFTIHTTAETISDGGTTVRSVILHPSFTEMYSVPVCKSPKTDADDGLQFSSSMRLTHSLCSHSLLSESQNPWPRNPPRKVMRLQQPLQTRLRTLRRRNSLEVLLRPLIHSYSTNSTWWTTIW